MSSTLKWNREIAGHALIQSDKGWTVVQVRHGHLTAAMPREMGDWHCHRDDLEEVCPRWYSKTHAYETFRELTRRKLNW